MNRPEPPRKEGGKGERPMALLMSAVGIALGAFVAVEPARAAQIWGSGRLKKLSKAEFVAVRRI